MGGLAMCKEGREGESGLKPVHKKEQTDREAMIEYLKTAYPKGSLDRLGRIMGVEIENRTHNGLF